MTYDGNPRNTSATLEKTWIRRQPQSHSTFDTVTGHTGKGLAVPDVTLQQPLNSKPSAL